MQIGGETGYHTLHCFWRVPASPAAYVPEMYPTNNDPTQATATATATTTATSVNDENNKDDDYFQQEDWTAKTVLQALGIFFLTGLAEIGGGWLVWKAVRDDDENNKKPYWWAVLGSAVLVVYGFLPTLQPVIDSFGRIYAAYGGFFIVLSLLWGWGLDGDKPDRGDIVGSLIALAGVCVLLFWPR